MQLHVRRSTRERGRGSLRLAAVGSFFALALVAATSGCSDAGGSASDAGVPRSEATGGVPDAGASGSPRSAAGAGGAGSDSGLTGVGDAAAQVADAGGDPGDAGGDEAGSDAGPDGGQVALCESGEARLGLDGGPLYMLQSDWGTNLTQINEVWSFQNVFRPLQQIEGPISGFALISGPGTYAYNAEPRDVFPQNTPLEVGSSLWALEATGTQLGPLQCTVPGSGSTLALRADQVDLDLQRVATLQCPGTPADGELSICLCGGENATGTIDGTPWTARRETSSFGLAIFADGSRLIHEAVYEAGAYRVTWGLLVTAVRGAYDGQIFCIASGSGDLMGGWTFRDFSRLDPCPADASGTLQGCAR